MTEKIDSSTPPIIEKADGLIGRYFHVFTDNRVVQYQGRVLAKLDEKHYLVQLYDFIAGNPNTIYIVPIDVMTNSLPFERDSGCWQFYENHQHWIDWFDSHR